MKITNNTGVPLGLAVWLVHDEYDYINQPNYISVTTLMKPLRQVILAKRVDWTKKSPDVADMISRALGHSLHDSIEKAWIKGYQRSLALLGYSEHVIKRVLVNPTPEELAAIEDPIPVYLEQRAFRKIGKWTVGGKFDMVAEGIVHDNKSTSAYTWVFGGRDDEHKLQGSLYRWLNEDKITEDYIRINYIFTDWQKAQARQNPKYPQSRLAAKDIPLLGVKDTEQWIVRKLELIEKFWDAPEDKIPECTPEDLWMSDPAYKYYSDASKTSGKSTKNFTSMSDARKHMAEKANKGIIITVPGEPKRCGYCDAYDICTQKNRYFT